MIYERSERRSTFLIGYCVSRLNHFVDRIFTQFDTSQDVIREVCNHLLLAEENVFMLARANERALAIEMTGMINSLAELCDRTSELGTGREAALTLDRHRATVLADKIETLGSIAVPPDSDMRTIYEFAAALAWYVNIAEAGVVDEDEGHAWTEFFERWGQLPDAERVEAAGVFEPFAQDGRHLHDSIGGRVRQFGIRLQRLDLTIADDYEISAAKSAQSDPKTMPPTLDLFIAGDSLDEERNAFIYKMRLEGMPLKNILSLVNKTSNWSPLGSVGAIDKILSRYPGPRGLPRLRKQRRKKL